jgi:hypothetical protein
MGWEDKRKGMGYHPEYDTARELCQLNYERGRTMCAAVSSLENTTPVPYESIGKPRKPGGNIGIRPVVMRQIREVYNKNGNPQIEADKEFKMRNANLFPTLPIDTAIQTRFY